MRAFLNVHAEKRLVWLQFVDDDENYNGTPPPGTTVEFSSSDPSVVHVDTDPDQPLLPILDPRRVGTATISAVVDGYVVESIDLTTAEAKDGTVSIVSPGAPVIQGK